MSIEKAIVEAACQRFRPIILTSITTTSGLMPLVFERSPKAAYLIPMAVSISFGLIYSTLLIIIAVPALLDAYENLVAKVQGLTLFGKS